jgi:Na+-translocating ferredoxin:NAD+ oxidoreductase RnfA subunit
VEPAGDLPVTAFTLPLLRDADFQAAWYYSMVVFAGLLVVGWSGVLSLRQVREMWRRGEHGLAATVGGASLLALLMFASIMATIAVAMLPLAFRGGAS